MISEVRRKNKEKNCFFLVHPRGGSNPDSSDDSRRSLGVRCLNPLGHVGEFLFCSNQIEQKRNKIVQHPRRDSNPDSSDDSARKKLGVRCLSPLGHAGIHLLIRSLNTFLRRCPHFQIHRQQMKTKRVRRMEKENVMFRLIRLTIKRNFSSVI